MVRNEQFLNTVLKFSPAERPRTMNNLINHCAYEVGTFTSIILIEY